VRWLPPSSSSSSSSCGDRSAAGGGSGSGGEFKKHKKNEPQQAQQNHQKAGAVGAGATPAVSFITAGAAGSGLEAALTPQYDVFLSHRQADAQDFCALLHTHLTAHGFKVFLDRKDVGKLHDLPAIVRHNQCFVFVLSDHIFTSKWCLFELKAAVEAMCAGVGPALLPLRMEGATWNGHSFPDVDDSTGYVPNEVEVAGSRFQVRPLLRELFKTKAVEHSREYFDAFLSKLVKQLPAPHQVAAQQHKHKQKEQNQEQQRQQSLPTLQSSTGSGDGDGGGAPLPSSKRCRSADNNLAKEKATKTADTKEVVLAKEHSIGDLEVHSCHF